MKNCRFSFILCWSFLLGYCLPSFAVDVPEHLDFAGMRLKIKEAAKQKIATDVERLSKNDSKYTQARLDRIQLYFPIIERILAEEGLPGEFKYLVIQESDLVSDAVSSSNAVGFWQFKRETALEMGLVITSDIDERKHIIASTRAAARYLKRNNFFLNNWINALMAYNTGLGGAKNLISESDRGATHMDITADTHWYVLKFLAYRMAFEKAALPGPSRLTTALLEYPNGGGKRLADIARELNVNEEDIALYNKWLTNRRVPEDRPYILFIPVPVEQAGTIARQANLPAKQGVQFNYEYTYDVEADARQSSKYPILEKKEKGFFKINGRPGIQARAGDNVASLASKADISVSKFTRYNDLSVSDKLIPGQVYYLKKKKTKGKIHYHTFIEGENLWQISQKYGMRLSDLKRKNRIVEGEKMVHGRVLWLRFRRSSDKPIEIRNVPNPQTKPDPRTAIIKKITKNPTETMVKQPTVTDAGGQIPTKPQVVPVPRNEEAVEVVAPSSPVVNPAKAEDKPVVVPVTPATPVKEDVVFLKSHEVQPGETLFSIARQYQTTVEEIRGWNNLTENTSLRVGQKLVVGEESRMSTQPVSSQPAKTTPGLTEHFVQAGETLYSISRRYSISVDSLRQWNELPEGSGLKVGQKLLVATPAANKQPITPVVIEYVVQPGDTMYKISKLHHVSVAQLMDWNHKTIPSVAVGEKLQIKK